MNRFFAVGILAVMVLLTGCKTLDYATPITPVKEQVPDTFFNAIIVKNSDAEDSASSGGKENWRTVFNSGELEALIEQALNRNFDLIGLRTKIAQEEASLKKEEAGFFPTLDFSFGGTKKETQVKKSRSQSTTRDGSHSWDGSLTGSYTADIWGEQNAEEQSRISSLEAARLDLKASTLDIMAQVAQTWIDIITTRNKRKILDQQIKINGTLLELQKMRFSNGKADALDVSQQREALAEATSQVPLLEQQEQLLLNTLSFLLGKTAMGTLAVDEQPLPEAPSVFDIGIPSDLLENRPDIQAAMMRLRSSQWDIEKAKADLLPSLSLSARALFSSGQLELLFSNWVASLTASLAGPVFDAGLRRAEVERVKAVLAEKVNSYAKIVAAAIKEVEDSLVRVQKQKNYIRLLEEELAVARLTLKDAMVQYRNGQSSYLSYLTAWTSIERLERQLVGERATVLKEIVNIYTSLGWQGLRDNAPQP